MLLLDRKTVLDAHREGPSNYVLRHVVRSVAEHRGGEEARRFHEGLFELTRDFESFKSRGRPVRDEAQIQMISQEATGSHDLLVPYLLSALAFQCYRRGDPQRAFYLLEQAKACDERLILEEGLDAFYPHLLQSDHNICRVLIRQGRSTEARERLTQAIMQLLGLFASRQTSFVVSLELMGLQLISYLVGLVDRQLLGGDCSSWELHDLPASHALANLRLWKAIRSADAGEVVACLADRRVVYFGIFKNHALRVLKQETESRHDG